MLARAVSLCASAVAVCSGADIAAEAAVIAHPVGVGFALRWRPQGPVHENVNRCMADGCVCVCARMHAFMQHTYIQTREHTQTHVCVCSVHTRTHTDMHLVPTRTNTNARATRGYTRSQTTLTIRCSGDACHSSPFDFLPLVGMSLTQSRIITQNTHMRVCLYACLS